MKKPVLFLLLTTASFQLIAGGLVTNTSQSAMFTRFQCRDATIDIDAAFYNPAGLVHLSNGFYLSINNQTTGQLKLITSEYENFTGDTREFRGRVLSPMFPGLYGVYKRGRFAFSMGINPIGGDGITRYEDGLPSYEREVADIISSVRDNLGTIDESLASVTEDPLYRNILAYKSDMRIKTGSIYTGYQLNAAYAINEYISVAAGIRAVDAKTSIQTELSDIVLDVATKTESYKTTAEDYLRSIATDAVRILDTLNTDFLIAAADRLIALPGMQADVNQSGRGLTPVISINYAPSLRTNWSLRYEFGTRLDLKTNVIDGKDGGGRYKDGSSETVYIPAMLSVGVTRRPFYRLMIYSGIHYYFNKPVRIQEENGLDLDNLDNNSYEFALGAEYKLCNDIRLSAGWLFKRPGTNMANQVESRYTLASNTIGTGLGLRLSRLIDLSIGGSYTLYKKDGRNITYTPADSNAEVIVKEYYDTRKWVLSVGVDFLFGESH